MADFVIEQWLTGKVDFNVPELTIRAILFDRGVEPGANMGDLSERDRDLCFADLLLWVADSSTSSSGEYISDNGWIHQKSGKNATNRDGLRARAYELYKKWGVTPPNAQLASIKMSSLY